MRFLSHNTRKTKKLEGLIISWLHEGYDVLCLSETIRKPDLPFVWNSKNQDIKTFSSLHPDKKWGATIVLGSKVSHFAAKVEVHTTPGLICAVALHLPGMHPLLIASIYAPPDDPSAREAIAKELDRLLLIFPNFVWAGDFNCAVQQIDTTAVTPNFWPWLREHVLIDGDIKDSFRMFHPDSKSYTRYPNNIHSSQVRNDYIFFSEDILAHFGISLHSASILQDKTSDHYPVDAVAQLPLTPLDDADMHNPTRFRGLTSKETQAFQTSIQPLTEWVENNPPSHFSQEEWSSHANHIFQQISRAYHSITAPHQKHRATQIEKEFAKACSSLPSIGSNRSTALDALQRLAVKWRKKIQEKQKKRLHFSLVRHRRIKKTVQDTLNPPTRDRVTLWETSEHESVASEPAQVGKFLPKQWPTSEAIPISAHVLTLCVI